MHISDIVEQYLCKEEAKSFAEWAFGPEFMDIDSGMKFLYMWNDIHRHDLELVAEGSISEDIPRMIEVWRKRTAPSAPSSIHEKADRILK